MADQIAYIHRGKLLFQRDKDQLLQETAIVRCSGTQLDRLPRDLVVARQDGGLGGSAALVRDVTQVRRLLPNAVIDRVTIDEMMQFYAGRESK